MPHHPKLGLEYMITSILITNKQSLSSGTLDEATYNFRKRGATDPKSMRAGYSMS